MLARTDVSELRQFVHAIIQAETYGVPVSRVLRAQAAERRERRHFRAGRISARQVGGYRRAG